MMADPFRRWPEMRFKRLIALEAALQAHGDRIAAISYRFEWLSRIRQVQTRIAHEADRIVLGECSQAH